MLYSFLKILSRLAIHIYCRKIIINKPALLKSDGPLLLASNHPNSFLDSVILDTLFEKPVWSLARGDVFKKPFHIKLLTALKILPVYRTSEGAENLTGNYKTFSDCIELFRNNALVCIFSEGKCINEWHLRPLKKGTARLSIKAWEENIPLRVLPVGINYSSFRRFGKNIFLNFGNIIERNDIDISKSDGVRNQQFNEILERELKELVYEIPQNDTAQQKEKLSVPVPVFKKLILFIPALTGFIIHAPLYWLVKGFTFPRTKDNDHFDSVMTALLLLIYPLYILITATVLTQLFHSWIPFLLLLIAPVCAWSFVQLHSQQSIRSSTHAENYNHR
jgi:1-acyl-sn-glycerol-3-phosphate acyltransferase